MSPETVSFSSNGSNGTLAVSAMTVAVIGFLPWVRASVSAALRTLSNVRWGRKSERSLGKLFPGHARRGGQGRENGRMANADQVEGSSTRHRILQVSLSLMSQKGVDGTSMRDLASAAGLNVASLYHYFPSKRELLEAVLVERGYLLEWDAGPKPAAGPATESALAAVLTDILVSMFDLEDFVRLMAGEAMRGEETARAVGVDLFTTFEAALAEWIVTHRPDLDERAGASAVAHLLTAMVVGIFVQYAAGVGGEEERDMNSV